jgi:hypothetical protein
MPSKVVVVVTQGRSGATGGGSFLTGGAVAATSEEASRCPLARPSSFTELLCSSK